MKFAITGGTGFVGRNIARQLQREGHEVVLVARGKNDTDPSILSLPGITSVRGDVSNIEKLVEAFAGCAAIAHCAGINRELGDQRYEKVHVEGTENVIAAVRRAGVPKIAFISFLRARPDCRSGYHETKWAAEELVRNSGLDYTVFKCGVIYGKGDHMLDHLSHAFHTFPIFAFVGFKDQDIRPNAVEDVARIVTASLTDNVLSRQTVAIVGPEKLTLREAVRRVAEVVGRKPLMFPMPVWFHYVLGWVVEKIMVSPLVSVAQVRMLAEGIAEASPPCDSLPPHLAPTITFGRAQIRKGLPVPGPFHLRDLRRVGRCKRVTHSRGFFYEMP
jgi:NADH dehydrogenase